MTSEHRENRRPTDALIGGLVTMLLAATPVVCGSSSSWSSETSLGDVQQTLSDQ